MSKPVPIKGILFALAILTVLYFAFFWRLDGALLWRDEASTANWARAMVQTGSWLPKVYDGHQLMVQGDDGHDFGDHFLPIMQSWLQFYVCAFSFKLFGVGTFTARVLFSLISAIGILVVFQTTRRIFDEKWLAYLAAALTALSAHYLTYARHARYYGLIFLFSLLTVYEIISYLKDRKRGERSAFYLRLYFYALALYFSNYFSFGIFWASLSLFMLFVGDRKVLLRYILTSFLIVLTILPEFYFIHLQFMPRSDAAKNHWEMWRPNFDIVYQRVQLILPVMFLIGFSFLTFWKRTKAASAMRWQLAFLLSVFLTSPLIAFAVAGERAIVRYYLHILPIAILILVITFDRIRKVISPVAAWLVLSVVFFFHTLNFWTIDLDYVVPSQFTKDNRVTGPAFDFIRTRISPQDNVAFVRNSQGQLAYFYFPWLKWCRLLDHNEPENQKYRGLLPDRMYDDYEDIDWWIVWDLKAPFQPPPDQFELVYTYRWDHPRRWHEDSQSQRFMTYQFYRRKAKNP